MNVRIAPDTVDCCRVTGMDPCEKDWDERRWQSTHDCRALY